MLPASVQAQFDNAQALQTQINTVAEEGNPVIAAAVEAEKPQSAEPAVTAQVVSQDHDASYWRHRFDVLQGKYNAEIPALRKEIKDLTQKVSQGGESGNAVQRAQTAMSELTQEEIEANGPELVALIKKVAGSITPKADDMDDVRTEVARLRDERQQDAQARFMTDLDRQIPNWRDINGDPAFHEWLNGTDMLSGAQRQQLLTDAERSLDVYRIAAIFNSFGGKPAVKKEIPAELVQPGQSRSSTTVSGQRIWTRADISKFYREASTYSKEEAAALEADIFAAQSQGRIR